MIFSGLLWLEFDKYRLVGKRGQVDRTPDPLHRARSSIFYVLFLSFFVNSICFLLLLPVVLLATGAHWTGKTSRYGVARSSFCSRPAPKKKNPLQQEIKKRHGTSVGTVVSWVWTHHSGVTSFIGPQTSVRRHRHDLWVDHLLADWPVRTQTDSRHDSLLEFSPRGTKPYYSVDNENGMPHPLANKKQ